ncbi:MAG: hypothetical protein U0793_23370 [Gemmataceae bacterium]
MLLALLGLPGMFALASVINMLMRLLFQRLFGVESVSGVDELVASVGHWPMGLLLHGADLATRSLWIPILMHALNNNGRLGRPWPRLPGGADAGGGGGVCALAEPGAVRDTAASAGG